jgi:hypothetical protein
MVTAEVNGEGVAAVAGDRTVVTIGAPDWTTTARGGLPTVGSGASVRGRASRLEFPPAFVHLLERDGNSREEVLFDTERLEPGRYRLRVDGSVPTVVAFEGAATVSDPGMQGATLGFDSPTEVTVGFGRRRPSPGTVTVPETPAGVAQALSVTGAGHRTDSVARSHPAMRGQPPAIEYGETTSIPDAVAARVPPSDVELRLPADLRYLVPAASLAYYLGANVTVDRSVRPALDLPYRTHHFASGPTFAREVAALLRRTFLLDTLVRARTDSDATLAETDVLDDLELDPGRLASADVATRVARYLDVPFEAVDEDLPEWHLSMYIDPRYEHVPTLPHLLSNVPNVFPPESEPLEQKERLTRSLDDFYRADSCPVAGVDPVKPLLGPGHSHGWLADGVPIDVFKSLPSAHARSSRRGRDVVPAASEPGRDEPISVVTVLNDIDMSQELAEAAQIYEEYAHLPIEVTERRRLDRAELAEVLQSDYHLVHYIGHCDAAGLRCVDGNLAVSDLPEVNVETFILNACGSYYEGMDLVRAGSVAGAVTFDKVLDSQAARVGTAFVRLLVHGFSIDRAMALARRRIIMGKDYAVVGDGTHTLTPSDATVPLAARLEERDDAFELTYEGRSPRIAGGWYDPPAGVDGPARLYGAAGQTRLGREALLSVLSEIDMPVVYDGDIRWSEELLERLYRSE